MAAQDDAQERPDDRGWELRLPWHTERGYIVDATGATVADCEKSFEGKHAFDIAKVIVDAVHRVHGKGA